MVTILLALFKFQEVQEVGPDRIGWSNEGRCLFSHYWI